MVSLRSFICIEIWTEHCASTMGLRTVSLTVCAGGLLGKPLRSSKPNCGFDAEGLGIPPKYSKINGCAMAGSILPTITTVNVEGSLKQLSKYSQAFLGSILGRSLTCGGL
uniref:Uncharacterized protein n=1 Tax=Opuntia streptacantha TaxID=393608 RepID=A0A7C9B058_OPUST